VRYAARGFELAKRELSTFIASIESLGAEVNGIGAIGDRCANGVEGPRR
jgi:hypothetical protein